MTPTTDQPGSGFVPSLIRTWVPFLVGGAATWLAARYGIVIDAKTKAEIGAALAVSIGGFYYAVVRRLERKWPAVGWLLGMAKAPAYSPLPPPEPEPLVISSTDPKVLESAGVMLAPHVRDELTRMHASIPTSSTTVLRARSADTGNLPILERPENIVRDYMLEETVIHGRRLGRHVLHDERSRDFPAVGMLVAADQPIVTVHRKLPGRPLNQHALGSCTGNAVTHLTRVSRGKAVGLTEKVAIEVYERATQLDSSPGSYPPNDTGSDGLSALKAAVQLGLIAGAYHWCFGLSDVLKTLSGHGAVVLGAPWYEGFDSPAADGTLKIAGAVRGGHEVCLLGVDAETHKVTGVNSWGPWGPLAGYFQLDWDTLDQLLHQHADVATI